MFMFLKLIRIILNGLGFEDSKKSRVKTRKIVRKSGKSRSDTTCFVKNQSVLKSNRRISKKSSGFGFILDAFRYMNFRTREVNKIGSSTTKGPKHILYHIKDYLSKPGMIVVFVLVPVVYLISPKALILLPTLVVVGALALVIQSFLPIYIGLDFSLMGAVLGSILFGPIVGVAVVLFTYILAVQLPSGQQDALEYERVFLFSFLALIIPYIPTNDIMLKAIIATYIGEFFEMVWHRYGENYPWMMAFLKVFPRSLIYIYLFHNLLGYLV